MRRHASGAVIWEETQDLIDFTALAAPLSHAFPPSTPPPAYWFYLHDTMEAGPAFRRRLLQRTALMIQAHGGQGDVPTVALTSKAGKSMNLGLYAHDHLVRQKASFQEEVVAVLEQKVSGKGTVSSPFVGPASSPGCRSSGACFLPSAG